MFVNWSLATEKWTKVYICSVSFFYSAIPFLLQVEDSIYQKMETSQGKHEQEVLKTELQHGLAVALEYIPKEIKSK